MTTKQNDFLPEYDDPPKKVSGYINKFPEGETKFRILSSPVTGYEGWKDRKPLRFKNLVDAMKQAPFETSTYNPKGDPVYFWALIVWSYSDNAIKILNLKQKTIQDKIKELANDPDWGDVKKFDIKVIKTGVDKETEYSVNPVPHKEITAEIELAFKDKPINLEVLFSSGDPFEVVGNKQLTIPF